jgi:hypothetical protein
VSCHVRYFMKRLLLCLPLIALGFTTSCKKTDDAKIKNARDIAANIANDPDAAANKLVELQKEMATILEGATDKPSLEAALIELAPVMQQVKAFATAAKQVDGKVAEPSAAKQKEVMEAMTGAQTRIQAAMVKLGPLFAADPELAKKVTETMTKMGQ